VKRKVDVDDDISFSEWVVEPHGLDARCTTQAIPNKPAYESGIQMNADKSSALDVYFQTVAAIPADVQGITNALLLRQHQLVRATEPTGQRIWHLGLEPDVIQAKWYEHWSNPFLRINAPIMALYKHNGELANCRDAIGDDSTKRKYWCDVVDTTRVFVIKNNAEWRGAWLDTGCCKTFKVASPAGPPTDMNLWVGCNGQWTTTNVGGRKKITTYYEYNKGTKTTDKGFIPPSSCGFLYQAKVADPAITAVALYLQRDRHPWSSLATPYEAADYQTPATVLWQPPTSTGESEG